MSAVPQLTPRVSKAYWEMNTEELAEATKEFDQEIIIDESRPMTLEERTERERIQRGFKKKKPEPKSRVSAVLPRSLVREIDALARHWQCSRANVVRLGLGHFLRQRKKKR